MSVRSLRDGVRILWAHGRLWLVLLVVVNAVVGSLVPAVIEAVALGPQPAGALGYVAGITVGATMLMLAVWYIIPLAALRTALADLDLEATNG